MRPLSLSCWPGTQDGKDHTQLPPPPGPRPAPWLESTGATTDGPSAACPCPATGKGDPGGGGQQPSPGAPPGYRAGTGGRETRQGGGQAVWLPLGEGLGGPLETLPAEVGSAPAVHANRLFQKHRKVRRPGPGPSVTHRITRHKGCATALRPSGPRDRRAPTSPTHFHKRPESTHSRRPEG